MADVRLEIEDRLAMVTLCRPDNGNRVDERTAAELAEACARADLDDRVRVVVLTGAGDGFCTGSELPDRPDPDAVAQLRAAGRLAAIGKPVIAAVNGDAIDQGLELALACDLRVASLPARLGLTHVARGLIPWDGGTQRLPRLIGPGRAAELILTGRLIDGAEAQRIGLVNEAVEPDEVLARARQIAGVLADHGPIAQRYAKEAVLEGRDMTLAQGLRLEADLSFILHGTADRQEGIASFLERRPPKYTGE